MAQAVAVRGSLCPHGLNGKRKKRSKTANLCTNLMKVCIQRCIDNGYMLPATLYSALALELQGGPKAGRSGPRP